MKLIKYLEMIINNQEIDKDILYVKPSLSIEIEELERITNEFGYDIEKLIESFNNGVLTKLSDNDWNQLENTDSNQIDKYEDVKKLSLKYNKNLNRVYKQITKNKKIEAPIVLYRKEKSPYLVAGNTRLMTLKSLNFKPMIWAIQEPKIIEEPEI